ncbi:MAG: hypothetical protein J3R72DRAFT_196126 [Linnemannia gamsii]|nr:MAG: hypothetical protein J3R72DRAFT_196126 [Linnemannia gamsii]
MFDKPTWIFTTKLRGIFKTVLGIGRRVVITGTSGIGKSAFLVYYTVRPLATGHDDNPPIVVFHEKGGSKCYAYGGMSTLRGDIEGFRHFASLRETWYLVDSSPDPQLVEARTIISASPKTVYFKMNQYRKLTNEYHGVTTWPHRCWKS